MPYSDASPSPSIGKKHKGRSFASERKNNNWKSRLPSYEDYKNGRMSELDVMLANVKYEVQKLPEAQVAPKKISHWNDVFKYQRDRWRDNFQTMVHDYSVESIAPEYAAQYQHNIFSTPQGVA